MVRPDEGRCQRSTVGRPAQRAWPRRWPREAQNHRAGNEVVGAVFSNVRCGHRGGNRGPVAGHYAARPGTLPGGWPAGKRSVGRLPYSTGLVICCMASRRSAVPVHIKRVLLDQAGYKCANPGCPNSLTEFHHIHEWRVYQTHDAEHMIAICPACHDAVDRGDLQISDEELYGWKGIDRSLSVPIAHIFVEPGPTPRLRLGSITVQGESGVIVFDLSERHRLSLAVRDGDIAAKSQCVHPIRRAARRRGRRLRSPATSSGYVEKATRSS
jgi:hypothetical protein